MVPGGGGRRRARARGHERAARDPHRPGPGDDSCSPLSTWMHVVCSRSWVFASPQITGLEIREHMDVDIYPLPPTYLPYSKSVTA